jgi:hypothetical protein
MKVKASLIGLSGAEDRHKSLGNQEVYVTPREFLEKVSDLNRGPLAARCSFRLSEIISGCRSRGAAG